ncbi:hypothetical protein PPYR_09423 [Photinus pyralis]|uniref:NADH dehydrogenase [ubiquinone] 1 alpha subcomplex assembly factor 3 n=1 Tax=Photinus pyralis TaxID=7054 RepID=A0A1Y1NCV0_PHOPY|nr:NADH dehydrogenase [ubiquinone] 1 alpha subcomplex assembly factor 3 [Photinus pyralis]KAB0798430.1 hypothetical protein PPYR_09423 [Photinus pyralis]
MFHNCVQSILRTTRYNYNVKHFRRFISTNQLNCGSSYQGDGKTTAHILNSDADSGLLINGISEVGFRLNNSVTVLGPMVIFPRSVLSWCIRDIRDINEESLSLFTILEPSIEIIVLGVGDSLENPKFYQSLLPFMRKHLINIEVLPTEQACTTFNFLNSEGRYVAAGLIPPQVLQTTDDDLLRTKLRYQNLYETNY